VRSIVWKSSLADLKALLSVADVLLCCDSGVMHMGAACGCRVVAICGPTALDIFAPHGTRHQIVKVDPMSCRPCLDSCIYSRPICMDEIIEGVVSAALRRAIVACTDGSVWQKFLALSVTLPSIGEPPDASTVGLSLRRGLMRSPAVCAGRDPVPRMDFDLRREFDR